MITIIHGTDIVASRKYFFDEKQKFADAQLIDGEKIAITDLTQIFEGGGLFEEQKSIFIEHFFVRKKKKEEFAQFSNYLEKQSSHDIFLWEGKELEKSSLMVFKTATPRVFKLPQTLFVLMDSLRPGNGKSLISLFHQTLATTDAEMIFFMLVRQVRLLLGMFETTDESIDELKRLAPWQKTKLAQQAGAFGKEELITLYNKLFVLEVGQKTGSLTGSLALCIDFLLLEI